MGVEGEFFREKQLDFNHFQTGSNFREAKQTSSIKLEMLFLLCWHITLPGLFANILPPLTG